MKGSKPVADVKKDLGKYLDRIIYMPISIWISREQ